MQRFLYNIVLHALAAPFLAAYYGPRVLLGRKYRRSLRGKLGHLPPDFRPEALPRPRIWFHAVSVGEVVALAPVVKAVKELVPSAVTLVSTGTETGQDKASEAIPEADGLFYLPLDFPAFVDRVVDRVRPDLFVLMETELWPNLVHSLKRSGAAVVLANGRISDRSFPRYRKLKTFFAPTLDKIDLFLMTTETDGLRIEAMGAPRHRVRITGNTKFDAALGKVPVEAEAAMREMFEISETDTVLVAGSTHPGENEIVLDAYRALTARFPELLLILVPRHVEKTPAILAAMQERKMDPPFLRSVLDKGEKRNGRKVIVVDRTGELFKIYCLASLVFVGGSLVPRGGQNILEPAAWGKVVLFGQSMEDFREARDILTSSGAGREVTGGKDLASQAEKLLADRETATKLGDAGRREIMRHVGCARRNAELLAELLKSKQKS